MRVVNGRLVLAPTDLATFVGCRHRTGLDLAVAAGELERPRDDDPYAEILRRRGLEHEARYVEALRTRGLAVVTIARDDGPSTVEALARQSDDTNAAMRGGADAIVQARLSAGTMAGYADVLVRVETPSALGNWSYEAQDTKLALRTRGGTILQLCAYSELLERIQGRLPARFHVVTPDPAHPVHTFRTADYLAYYRAVRRSLESAAAGGHAALLAAHYPEPVEHCQVCAWEAACIRRRRDDDHLSLIAGASRLHRTELAGGGYGTLAAVGRMPVPVPFRPSRGSRETYDRLGDQARVQLRQREERRPVFERLPLIPGEGLSRLPAPSPGDVFLDLEGARFACDGGREFLFGLYGQDYAGHWAATGAEEKAAFETVIDRIVEAWHADPGMHVYHFNHYEPTAFKKLAGRHVTRADALDRLLRAERFVDLYPIVRQAVRCGVESYSIKQLEPYYRFTRRVALPRVAQPRLAVELALEAGTPDGIPLEIATVVQGYNEDDCRSTAALRDWLEQLRHELVAGGQAMARPEAASGEPSSAVGELQQQVETLRSRLLGAGEATLAYLIDWQRREDNAQWWEYFRLKELPEDELLDEARAVAGLRLVERVHTVTHKRTGKPTGSVVDRYTFPSQELDLRSGSTLQMRDGRAFGDVQRLDREARLVEIRKGPKVAGEHPSSVFAADVVLGTGLQRAVMRVAERMLAGQDASSGADLLRRRTPRLRSGTFGCPAAEEAAEYAVRIVDDLDRTTLAIQGPPGAGKTYAGARMIRALVRAGKRVGVTATSHKVVRNLLEEVHGQARAELEVVRLAARVSEPGDGRGPVREFDDYGEALAAIGCDVDVLGGTAWLWSREEFANSVDVLFVDEAGQMSLASVLAVSQAAGSLVLLGDPQQLQQPQKASHPDGVGVSALSHVLGTAETMPTDLGLFLPVTYRMAPAITRFTSELFYDGRLESHPSLAGQVLRGTSRFDGAGLWLIPVAHDGNQTTCPEEVEAVADLVSSLVPTPLGGADLRVVAPFNAQVNRLAERLAQWDVPVGTVDRFQGQTAQVVIYSMTTSRPEDAPRGLEFLYSLNRLNVATSRARCAVFVVCSPLLLEPECRTPRQMQLANALCRYRELAHQVERPIIVDPPRAP